MKLFFALFLLPFCALAQDASIGTAACGPDSTTFEVKANDLRPSFEAKPTKTVVFVAESVVGNSGITPPTLKLGLDGKWIGATRSDSWLSFTVDPGEHHLCVRWQSSRLTFFSYLLSLANFNAEAGKILYFRSRILGFSNSAVLDLDPINEDEGRYLVLTSRQSEARQKK